MGSAVDVPACEQVLGPFFQATQHTADVPARGSSVLAGDGTTLRGTIPAGHTTGMHLGAAYVPTVGLVLAQRAVDQQENDSVVVPTLLAHLDLTGVVVVGDALQTQRDLSSQIVEAGGDDVWVVQDNQATLRAASEQLFPPVPALPGTSDPPSDFGTARQGTKGHGRLEERSITISSALQDYSDWPSLAQVVKRERRVWNGDGRARVEIRSGVTRVPSTVADAQRLLAITRADWGIENGLHDRRDVTLQEDASQVRRGGAPQVLAALNNAVIGITQQAGEVNLAAAQRRFAYPFDRLLARIAASPPSLDFA